MLYVSGVNEGDQGGGSKGKLGEGWGQHCARWGRLTCSMGPERMGTHIHAPRATTLSKDFTFGNPFVDIKYCTILCQYCIFFSSAG